MNYPQRIIYNARARLNSIWNFICNMEIRQIVYPYTYIRQRFRRTTPTTPVPPNNEIQFITESVGSIQNQIRDINAQITNLNNTQSQTHTEILNIKKQIAKNEWLILQDDYE